MLSWSDVVGCLGFVALAILGGYLKCLPTESVVALSSAAVAYFMARTLQMKRQGVQKGLDEHSERQDAIPEYVKHQISARVITVKPNGTVQVSEDVAELEPSSDEEVTPVEHRLPPKPPEPK